MRIAVLRRMLFIVGLTTISASIVAPALRSRLLPAASSLEGDLVWILIVAAGSILGLISLIAGCVRLDGAWRKWGGRAILSATTLMLAFVAVQFGLLGWRAYIAPTATILLPIGFSGTFTIQIQEYLQPSWGNAGRHYRYVVPSSGSLSVGAGWIAHRFRFESGQSVPGGYYVHIMRDNGVALRYDEFDCLLNESQRNARTLVCTVRPPL